jgi:3-carboxy-cis,cis-muconate cycloisomerase
VPTTFGLKAAGWLVGVLDARDRLAAIRATLPVQLGGAAGTLAGYVEYARLAGVDDLSHLVEAYAAELDLAAPVLPWHTRRAVFAVLGSALAGVTGALGKLAVDVLTLARTEIGEVSEPSGVGRGTSSAMPQKRNPVLATLLRSAALQVPALVCVLSLAELSEDERAGGVWQSEWQPLRECLRLAGAAAEVAAELVEGLEVHVDRMRENLALSGGLVVSERVAAVLAPRIGKAQAKTVVARAALVSAEGGVDFGEALLDSPELTGLLDAAELKDLLGVEAYLGLADELVDRALRRPR